MSSNSPKVKRQVILGKMEFELRKYDFRALMVKYKNVMFLGRTTVWFLIPQLLDLSELSRASL